MDAEYLVILLLCIGIGLIVAEIIFIPGSAFLGVAGFIIAIAGVYVAFVRINTLTGWLTLGGFVLITGAIGYYGFKSGTWRRFALTGAIKSRVNDDAKISLKVGDRGKAISALRPSGKAEFGNAIVEVSTMGEFLDNGCPLRISRLTADKIFVEAVD